MQQLSEVYLFFCFFFSGNVSAASGIGRAFEVSRGGSKVGRVTSCDCSGNFVSRGMLGTRSDDDHSV